MTLEKNNPKNDPNFLNDLTWNRNSSASWRSPAPISPWSEAHGWSTAPDLVSWARATWGHVCHLRIGVPWGTPVEPVQKHKKNTIFGNKKEILLTSLNIRCCLSEDVPSSSPTGKPQWSRRKGWTSQSGLNNWTHRHCSVCRQSETQDF